MNMEDDYGPSAAALALGDLDPAQRAALIDYASRNGLEIDCIDHVDSSLEPIFNLYRQRYSFWLSGGTDGVNASITNTEGLFALK